MYTIETALMTIVTLLGLLISALISAYNMEKRLKNYVITLRKEIYETWEYCTEQPQLNMEIMRERLAVVAALWRANGLPEDGLDLIDAMKGSAPFALRERLEALMLYSFYLDIDKRVAPDMIHVRLNLKQIQEMQYGMRFLRNSWTPRRGLVLALPDVAMRHMERWLIRLAQADAAAAPEAEESDAKPAPEPATKPVDPA